MKKYYFLGFISILFVMISCQTQPQNEGPYVQVVVPAGVTAYYISSKGDDRNDGLSEERPWRTIEPLNYIRTFGPGTWILFRGGDRFQGGLLLTMKGSAEAPCLISSYGNGKAEITDHMIEALPLIALDDSEYITVSNLKITGAPGKNYPGPRFRPGNRYVEGLKIYKSDHVDRYFESITVDNVEFRNSCEGLWIGPVAYQNFKAFSHIRVTNCLFDSIYQFGVRVIGYNPLREGPVDQFMDVYFGDNVFVNIKGDPHYRSEAQAISLFNTTGCVIERNLLVDNCGEGGKSAGIPYGGSAGLCVNQVRNFKIQYNVITGTDCWSALDGCAIDADQDSRDGEIAFNLTYMNNGPGIMTGSWGGKSNGNIDIHHNISINDARGCAPGTNQGALYIWGWDDKSVDDVRIFNNTIYVDKNGINPGTKPSCITIGDHAVNLSVFNNIFKTTGDVIVVNAKESGGIQNSNKFFNNIYDPSGDDNEFTISNYDLLNRKYAGIWGLEEWRAIGQEILDGVEKGMVADAGLGSLALFDPKGTYLPREIEQFAYAELSSDSPAIGMAIDPWPYAAADVTKKDFHGNTAPIVNIGACNTNVN